MDTRRLEQIRSLGSLAKYESGFSWECNSLAWLWCDYKVRYGSTSQESFQKVALQMLLSDRSKVGVGAQRAQARILN